MFRKAMVIFCTLATLFAIFAFGGTAFAAPPNSPAVNLAVIQKNCALLAVHLNGTQHPTTTCLSNQLPKASRPDTSPGTCFGATMEVTYNQGYGVCFDGTGYLGYYLPNVYFIETLVSVSWFRWYNSTSGYFCTMHLNSNQSYTPAGAITITQVDPGYSHSDSVC